MAPFSLRSMPSVGVTLGSYLFWRNWEVCSTRSSSKSAVPDTLVSGPRCFCNSPRATIIPIFALACESTLCLRSSAKLRSVPTKLTREMTRRKTKLIKARANTKANPLLLFFRGKGLAFLERSFIGLVHNRNQTGIKCKLKC